MAHFACLMFLLCRALKSFINHIVPWQKKLHLCCSSPVNNTCGSSTGCKKKKKKALFFASCVQQLQCPCQAGQPAPPLPSALPPHRLPSESGPFLLCWAQAGPPLCSKHLWAPDLLLYLTSCAVRLLVSNKNPFTARGKNVVLFHM